MVIIFIIVMKSSLMSAEECGINSRLRIITGEVK